MNKAPLLVALLLAFTALGASSATTMGCAGNDATTPAPSADAASSGDVTEPSNDAGGTDTQAPGDAGGDSSVDASMPPSNGCAAASAKYKAGTTLGSIAIGGATRTFRVHVPPSYAITKATPVVLLFHGGGGSGDQLENQSSKMDPIADREGFIAVYPNGTGLIRTWNGGNCCGKAVEDNIDDVAFVDALLDHLEGELCVDAKRVFAMGMSNGAILSHRLACELSSRIAAVAPIAGTIGVPTCQPSRPVPVLHIHGTNDAHVPWDGGTGCGSGGADFTSVPDTIAGWRARNACDAGVAPYLEQGNGACAAANGCQASVVLCTIDGGGHSWPGGEPKQGVADCPDDGPQSASFIASEAAWQFFSANPMK